MEPSNGSRWKIAVAVLLAAAACASWFLLRTPEGEAVREAVDQTAEEVTGKRAVDQGRAIEAEIRRFSAERREREASASGEGR